ncbi:MAG: flotillin [Maribacter sp.]|jgi:flotillin
MFNMAGMQLPEYLKGKDITSEEELVDAKKITFTKKKEE